MGRQVHADGYDIHRVPLIPRGNGRSVRLALNYLSFVVSGFVFGPWLLRKQSFDVILVFGTSPILQAIPAIWLKWLKGSKLVIWVQDLWPQSLEVTGHVGNRQVLGAVRAVTRWIYSKCDLLLAQSHAFIAALRPMACDVPISYHPNPGDLSFATSDLAEPPYVLRPGFNIVVAGNMGTAQAPQTLVEAARLLADTPAIRIVLFGSGSRWDWVRSEATRLALDNIEFAGRFPPAAMPSLLAQASATLVMLGKGEILTQTIPSKISTYMAAGRPIIGSIDGEGARIIAESGAGLASPAEDAPALVAAIRWMQQQTEEQRAKMGLAAKAYNEENFAPAKLAAKMLDHFEGLFETRSTSKRETSND